MTHASNYQVKKLDMDKSLQVLVVAKTQQSVNTCAAVHASNESTSSSSQAQAQTPLPVVSEEHLPLLARRSMKHSESETVNACQDDEFEIHGFRRSRWRHVICWSLYVATIGLLRLVFHWRRDWHLRATCVGSALDEADFVLIQERYQNAHKVSQVTRVRTVRAENIDTYRAQQARGCELEREHLETSVAGFVAHFTGPHFQQSADLRTFRYKELSYVWDVGGRHFRKLCGLDECIPSSYYHQHFSLSPHERVERRLVFGPNQISAPNDSKLKLLIKEATDPFYVFQVLSIALWFYINYYYYASVILFTLIGSLFLSVNQTKKNQKRLQKSIHTAAKANVYKQGVIDQTTSHSLVPGDIIEIPAPGCIMSCDAVLISGSCIVDEAMLTGESIPITKTPLPNKEDVVFNKVTHARHTLFSGTRVIQARCGASKNVLAFVINTGNLTARGELVRSILHPPPVDFRFEKDSYLLVQFLGLMAFGGFFYTIISKALRGVSVFYTTVDALDLITIAVPPALPATMTVGRIFAEQRLRETNIYCILPRAINIAGSINCCCFDKTGTLTEDGLDMWAVIPMDGSGAFAPAITDISQLPCDPLLFGMVTCHSISILEGKPSGDPLDLKMFESTGWCFDSSNKDELDMPVVYKPQVKGIERHSQVMDRTVTQLCAGMELPPGLDILGYDHGIVREFPFSSGLQRMAVISRRFDQKNYVVYCKGSPEMLQQLCKPETLPTNYAEQLAYYAKKGYRIIAMGYKKLPARIKYVRVTRLTREEVECDLHFVGFIIFENRLKPDTLQHIKTLKAADIRTIMVTGDNILTAVSVGYDCGIVDSNQAVVTVHTRPPLPGKGDVPEICYTLENATNAEPACGDRKDSTVIDIEPIAAGSMENWRQNYCLAIDGKTWDILNEHYHDQLPQFLVRGAIFARMSPEQKQDLVLELQRIDYHVAMCGDGANDCGALRAANVGVSLSQNDASLASPFTSTDPTIGAVIEVIRQGRAALVTSFGIIKYMAAYSMVQFMSVMSLYGLDANFNDLQFLYIDLGVITAISFSFGKTKAALKHTLSKIKPLTALLSPVPLASILLQVLVMGAFQWFCWHFMGAQAWFESCTPSEDDSQAYCYEGYMQFILTGFQYVIVAYTFSKGAPHRRAFWTNLTLCGILVANIAVLVVLTVQPPEFLGREIQRVPPVMDFRLILLLIATVNFLVSVLVEEVIVEVLIAKWQRARETSSPRSKYQIVDQQLTANNCAEGTWPIITRRFMEYEPAQPDAVEPSYFILNIEPNDSSDETDE